MKTIIVSVMAILTGGCITDDDLSNLNKSISYIRKSKIN